MRIYILAFILVLLASCKKEGSRRLPAEVKMNVSYGSDPAQRMDLYLPEGRSSDSTKMIVLVHGGAWTVGDKSEFTQYVPVLQQRLPNYAIANINYRLANSNGNFFPTQELDMKAVIDHLVQNSEAYGLSNDYVLLGASAGGHMSLLQAYKYDQPRIRAVVNFYGPSDMIALFSSTTDPFNNYGLQLLMGGTPLTSQQLYYESSPVHYITSASPPTITLHGNLDQIVPLSQSTALHTKLQTAGVANRLWIATGYGHDIWPQGLMNTAFDQIESFLFEHVK